jgi:urocanate hydratase
LAQRGVVPDLLTDLIPSQEPFDGYIPLGLWPEAHPDARHADAPAFRQRLLESLALHRRALHDLQKLGARVLTGQAGVGTADLRDYLLPLAGEGRRLSTWLALAGEPGDIARADRLALEIFSDDQRLTRWLSLVGMYVRFQGLPARVAWLRERQLSAFALALNDLVARREISGPILLGFASPFLESAPDASMQNARVPGKDSPLPETGACWVSTRVGAATGGPRRAGAQAVVADGTAGAAERIARWPTGGAEPSTP